MRHSNIGPKRRRVYYDQELPKHDGSLHRTWRDTMVLKTSENALIGCNDHLLVTLPEWKALRVTRRPALVYFP